MLLINMALVRTLVSCEVISTDSTDPDCTLNRSRSSVISSRHVIKEPHN